MDGGIFFLVNEMEFLKINNIVDKVYKKYMEHRESFFRIMYRRLLLTIFLDAFTETIAAFVRTIFSVVLFGSYNQGLKTTAGDVGASFSIFDEIRDKSGETRTSIAQVPHSVAPLERLDELLLNCRDSILFNRNIYNGDVLFSIQHIYFSMKGKIIINDLSLTVSKGEKIAIVGENGSGKSTLLKLLLGRYSPQKGSIEWQDGVKKDDIGYIPSDVQLYNLSACENILMGTGQKNYNMAEDIEKN